jgi:hypothetical protein
MSAAGDGVGPAREYRGEDRRGVLYRRQWMICGAAQADELEVDRTGVAARNGGERESFRGKGRVAGVRAPMKRSSGEPDCDKRGAGEKCGGGEQMRATTSRPDRARLKLADKEIQRERVRGNEGR